MDDRRAGLLLAAVLAVVTASLLWTVAMPAPHTGGDNAAYLALAQSIADGAGYVEAWDPAAPPHTKYPPGFPLLMSLLVAMGATAWAPFKALVASLVFGAVMLVYAWASRREGVLVGGAVATTTLLAAGWLGASRWILSEPLFLLLLFSTFWAFEPRAGTRDGSGPDGDGLGVARLAFGCVAAGCAVFTRTAGLPLILAVFMALVMAGRRRAAAFFAAGLAVPGLWWLGRARQGGEGAYQSEFWLIDPYQPELGTIGLLDLPVRVVRNLVTYVGRVLPSEWWGMDVPFAAPASLWVLGLLIVGLAMWGWLIRVQRGPGTPELFVPMYAGLILLWPEAWAGDRFSLPLYPLLLVYGISAITVGLEALPTARRSIVRAAVLTGAFFALAGPAVPGWLTLSEQSRACRRIAETAGPTACHAVPFRELGAAAAWTGWNLPDDAVILSRKPRLFYLFGGSAGRTFPFTQNPDRFLEEADRIGAGYLLLDRLDGISGFYLPPVIGARPDAFCHIGGWSDGGTRIGTELFGILPEPERGRASGVEVCPESLGSWPGEDPPTYRGEVPRLAQVPRVPSEAP